MASHSSSTNAPPPPQKESWGKRNDHPNPTRYLTTKLQVSGWKFNQARNEQALTRWHVGTSQSPMTVQASMFGVGLVGVALIVGIGVLLSILKPAPSRNIASINAVDGEATYVMFKGSLHPVTNLASARLIAGKADKATPVKQSQIEGIPKGIAMGIPSGPNNLNVNKTPGTFWAVCDWRTGDGKLSVTASPDQVTTVIAGKEVFGNAELLDKSRAVLARSAVDPSRLWLMWNGVRSEVGTQDFTSQNALGLTPEMIGRALVLSGGIINAVPTSPSLSTPPIPRRGQASSAVGSIPAVNGDVISVLDAKGGKQFYAVLPNGVQRIGEVIAQMLLNTGSKQVSAEASNVTSLPIASDIDTARYPDSPPTLTVPGSLCYTWSKEDAAGAMPKAELRVSDTLPISDTARNKGWTLNMNKPASGVVQASSVVMKPGAGYFARVTGNELSSTSAEQLLFIEDTGIRFFISPDEKGVYDQTVNALGINVRYPNPIPWNIAMLFPQGSNLGFKQALNEHTLLPVDQNQQPVEVPSGGTYSGPPAN